MKELQCVEVVFRESKRWFQAVFNHTFGFIRLMKPLSGSFLRG